MGGSSGVGRTTPPPLTRSRSERNASAAQLIEDLLDVSRIVVGKFQIDLRSIRSVSPIVDAVVDSFRPTFEAKRVTLDVAVEPDVGPIAGDPARLQQIVWNLISNAVKFTPAGRAVSVSCRQIDGLVEVRVSDSGKGIPPPSGPYRRPGQPGGATSTGPRRIGSGCDRRHESSDGGAVHEEAPAKTVAPVHDLPIAGPRRPHRGRRLSVVPARRATVHPWAPCGVVEDERIHGMFARVRARGRIVEPRP